MADPRDQPSKIVMDYYKLSGVKDLKPMKARAHFAKALMLESVAGRTTPEAEEQLELAIATLN